MAHPYNAHRQHIVERDRVAHITGHASGGAAHGDEAADRKLIKKMLNEHETKEMKVEGSLRHRAKGGRVKKGTTVNVVIAGQGDKQPMPVPVPAPVPAGAAPMPPPPRPAMVGPPSAGAAPPGMPPPGIRRSGGRAYARGGGVKSGPTWEEGLRNGTRPMNTPGKNDTDKINTRPALLTRKRGGRAYPLSAGADSGVGRLQLTKAQKSFKAP